MIVGLRKLRKYYATKIWSYTVINIYIWTSITRLGISKRKAKNQTKVFPSMRAIILPLLEYGHTYKTTWTSNLIGLLVIHYEADINLCTEDV